MRQKQLRKAILQLFLLAVTAMITKVRHKFVFDYKLK